MNTTEEQKITAEDVKRILAGVPASAVYGDPHWCGRIAAKLNELIARHEATRLKVVTASMVMELRGYDLSTYATAANFAERLNTLLNAGKVVAHPSTEPQSATPRRGEGMKTKLTTIFAALLLCSCSPKDHDTIKSVDDTGAATANMRFRYEMTKGGNFWSDERFMVGDEIVITSKPKDEKP